MVRKTNLIDFEKEVNEKLSSNWELHGESQCIPVRQYNSFHDYGKDELVFCQAMTYSPPFRRPK